MDLFKTKKAKPLFGAFLAESMERQISRNITLQRQLQISETKPLTYGNAKCAMIHTLILSSLDHPKPAHFVQLMSSQENLSVSYNVHTIPACIVGKKDTYGVT